MRNFPPRHCILWNNWQLTQWLICFVAHLVTGFLDLFCVNMSHFFDSSWNGTQAAVLKFVFNFYARVRWSEMQSPWHFCWRVCPGWLIGYRICDVTFFVPNQLHLILQLWCSLTPTCYTNWSLKLSLLVQLGYHMRYNESENVNFLVAGHMKRKWPHTFLTECAEKSAKLIWASSTLTS